MPWINLTVRRGALNNEMQHAVMSKLTDALMFWEKIPDTPEARKKMKGWVYEVAEDADYNGGSSSHKDPFYFLEVRLPAGRFDVLTKRHLILDFTKIILLAEGKPLVPEAANRIWVTIVELNLNPAVQRPLPPVRRLTPAVSNCCADHPPGDNCFSGD